MDRETREDLQSSAVRGGCAVLTALLLILAAIALLARSCCAADIKLIVAGQSNAVGYGPGVTKPDANVLAFDPSTGCFVPAADPMPFWEDRIVGAPPLGFRGAWITLGKILAKSYDHVYLTGGGRGGESISYWDVGAPGWAALSATIAASGRDAQCFVWYQGESDATAVAAGTVDWASKFADLVGRVRALCNNPALPVLVCQAADNNDPNYVALRQAQYAYTLSDDHAYLIPTHGFPLQADTLHLTDDGYDMVARAVAKQILGASWFVGPPGVPGPQGPQGPAGKDAELPAGSLLILQSGASAPPGAVTVGKKWRIKGLTYDFYVTGK